ncbi:hypothetical protein ACJMK2_041311, partial [Sinanodonta woodiana]
MTVNFRFVPNGDPIKLILGMNNATFQTSRDEVACTNNLNDLGGANITVTDTINYTANAVGKCGGRADNGNPPSCFYWIFKTEVYADFNSFYDSYYTVTCCDSNAVNIYQRVNTTIGDIRIVNKTYNPVAATLSWGTLAQTNLGDSNFLKLTVRFNDTKNVEGLNAYGAYIAGSGCYAYDFYDRTKRAQLINGNGCGQGALPFQISANQQAFTFDSAKTAPANGTPNDFITSSFEINAFETTRPGPHIITVECQIAFCYNSTDQRCFSGNTCQGSIGRRRRGATDPVEIQTVQATIVINDNPKKDTTCLEGSVFIAVTTVLALLIIMAFVLAVFLCVLLVTRRKTPK